MLNPAFLARLPASLWLVIFSLLSAGYWWFGAPDQSSTAPDRNLAVTHAGQAATVRYAYKPIEQIRVGEWVLAENPELEVSPSDDPPAHDPSQLRQVSLRHRKADGSALSITLLRDIAWLNSNGAAIGRSVDIDLEELGVLGAAEVLAIDLCPELTLRPSVRHHLVTGTFAHASASTLELIVQGGREPIRCTGVHPFWSVDRLAFVAASELHPGEQLIDAEGGLHAIETIKSLDQPTAVFNLEVNREHVYFVSHAAILVHNAYVSKAAVEAASQARTQLKLGKNLKPSPDPAVDWVDDIGKTYDQIGNPAMVPFWAKQREQFFAQVQRHLKKADFTVVDVTDFPPAIKEEISEYLLKLTDAEFDKIVAVGF